MGRGKGSFVITRRTFGANLGMATALPLFSQMNGDEKRLRYAIVGLGRISMDHFMPGCKQSKRSQVTALVSGHRDKAEKQAAAYNIKSSSLYDYTTFDRIADDKNVDAVYIALPNSMHAEFTIRAAKAGKHVLCEKPMATSIGDCKAMIESCQQARRKLMIAYRCHYEPTNLRAVKLIRDGTLGKIEAIESANGFAEHKGEWRLDRKLAGGGPLMDVGIYSLNACRYLTGEEPVGLTAVTSSPDKDGRFNQVEENLSWTMKFPSGIVAVCNTTYGAPMEGFFRVHGTNGVLHVEPAFAYQGLHLQAKIKGRPDLDEPNTSKDPSQFAAEADYFASCVLEDRPVRSSGDEGLRDMELMGKLYQMSGLSFITS